ncbi:transcriptional repressor [Candidatus Woesearchaeota archaeon]|nr:transcriptional repressor [Candidatus Woesearchaeota archaeon]
MVRQSRQTLQKKLLSQELASCSSFFTADEIFSKVKKKDDKIGIATVYRFLKEMKKNEQIHSYLCDRRVIYSTHPKNHCHFTCERCGKTSHITLDNIDFMKKKIEGNICHFQIDICGICTVCSNKK